MQLPVLPAPSQGPAYVCAHLSACVHVCARVRATGGSVLAVCVAESSLIFNMKLTEVAH